MASINNVGKSRSRSRSKSGSKTVKPTKVIKVKSRSRSKSKPRTVKNKTKPPALNKIVYGSDGNPREVLLESKDIITLFGKHPDDVLKKLRFTDVSLYSVTPYDQSIYTAGLLLHYYTKDELKNMLLTDASACIGGNTWSFAKLVKHVTAIEINQLHAEILKNNLTTLHASNVNVIQADFTDVLLNNADVLITNVNNDADNHTEEVKQDILFLDPPWGGIDYKSKKTLELSTVVEGASYTQAELIEKYLHDKASLIMLKIPKNYDLDSFEKTPFTYKKYITITDLRKIPLYILAIFSQKKPLTEPTGKSFNRLGYKAMVTKYVE
jgi:16S rRNA G966 N2-methylase RsmD